MTSSLWYPLRNALARRQFDQAGALLQHAPELRTERNRAGETVLHFMAVENDLPALRWLHQQGFDLDTVNDFGQPVLFEVAQLGYEQMLLWFAQAGADFTITDGEGQHLVAFLREVLHETMIDFLHAHRAELGLPAGFFDATAIGLRPRQGAPA